jgi:hypothetical protein
MGPLAAAAAQQAADAFQAAGGAAVLCQVLRPLVQAAAGLPADSRRSELLDRCCWLLEAVRKHERALEPLLVAGCLEPLLQLAHPSNNVYWQQCTAAFLVTAADVATPRALLDSGGAVPGLVGLLQQGLGDHTAYGLLLVALQSLLESCADLQRGAEVALEAGAVQALVALLAQPEVVVPEGIKAAAALVVDSLAHSSAQAARGLVAAGAVAPLAACLLAHPDNWGVARALGALAGRISAGTGRFDGAVTADAALRLLEQHGGLHAPELANRAWHLVMEGGALGGPGELMALIGRGVRRAVVAGPGPARSPAAAGAAGPPPGSSEACAGCGARAGGEQGVRLMRCVGCQAARYCSPGCQRTHWPSHRRDCKAARRGQGRGGK